jgi:hypothetical protein
VPPTAAPFTDVPFTDVPFTEGWAASLEVAANADPAVAAALAGHPVTIAQQVVDPPGPPRWHHVAVAPDGGVAVRIGRPDAADVTFTLDADTATRVQRGELDASRAFAEGRLAVDGDVVALPRHAGALGVLSRCWAAAAAAAGGDPGSGT